jgi:hypothetical protein
MRAILLILILAVVAVIIALATGFMDIHQTRDAQVPQVAATEKGVSAKGGQAPAFDVDTGSVTVEARDANVKVPALKVNPPNRAEAPGAGVQQSPPASQEPTPAPSNAL